MKTNRFPAGWDENRVRKVLEHYEDQSEAETVAEDEAAFDGSPESVVRIPIDLVPAVRELIGKHQAHDAGN